MLMLEYDNVWDDLVYRDDIRLAMAESAVETYVTYHNKMQN